MVSHVHVNLISQHVFISITTNVSNSWKSHWLMILRERSINAGAGVPRCSVKMLLFIVSQNSQESMYFGVSS